jgi:hypothetical protein
MDGGDALNSQNVLSTLVEGVVSYISDYHLLENVQCLFH